MLAAIRNAALAAIAAVLVFGGAGQARATVVYTDTSTAPTALSWSAPTFITPPTTGRVDITGILSCTVSGTPCTGGTPYLQFEAAPPGIPVPNTISVNVITPTGTAGGFFLPSDFGAVGTYTDAFEGAARATLIVSEVSAVPEPASLTLLVMGLAGLGMVQRTRRV